MALFGAGKSTEEKNLEKVARALEGMRIKEPDGMLHAGVLGAGRFSVDPDEISMVLDGVIVFLQKNGREIVDVKPGLSSGGDGAWSTYTVLYR